MINKERLFNRLLELGEIGKTDEGIFCLALSPEDNQAYELVKSYMEEAGLDVRVDLAGNLVGRMEGEDKDAPVLMTGSHIDTVYGGGIFDGRLGVIAGIEVAQTMKENGITPKCPIEVIAYRDEEGTRFMGSYSGAGHLTGSYTKDILEHVDKDGKSVAECLKECGIDPDRVDEARLPEGYAKAHLELHIEQGGVLESKDLAVGVVTGICCQIRAEFTLTGVASHAGTTPMDLRNDPMPAASEIILAIEDEAKKYPEAVATVGRIEAFPGGVNVIPGKVKFSLDARNQKATLRDEMFAAIEKRAKEICEARGIQMEIELLMKDKDGTPCAPHVQEAVVKACEKSGQTVFKMPSGAGHDSTAFGNFCPMGMIFIRSKDGISHSKVEWSTKEDCEAGANVLYHTMVELAME